jgi:4-amino-4-deoxy-L-arabinose transferase-like glycosyltransferase
MTEAIALPLTFFNGLFLVAFAGAGKYSLKIFSDMFAARLPVVLISSLIPVGIYYYGSSIFSKKLSLIAAFVYIFNPISIALDREVVNDSFLTLFTFFALISYIYYSRKKVLNIIPGIFLSLAFLTKPDGLMPILGWVFLLIFVDRSRYAIKYFLINVFSFLLIVTVLWPPSWRMPVFAIFEYLYRQFSLVQVGMGVFYKGVVTNNPGFDFYIFQYLVRMPVALILGFIVSILIALRSVLKKPISIKPAVIPIVLYNLTFFLLISFSSKKLGIRYAEPLLPWFVILSSWGLIWLVESIHNRYLTTVAVLIIALNILTPLSYNPDYYFYYNFLVGGPKGAQKYDMVGFCSSTRLATDYLEERNMTGSVFVAGCPDPVRYYWAGLDITYNYLKADYIILETYYVDQHPEDPVLAYLANKTSVKDIQFHGAIIARIYKQN